MKSLLTALTTLMLLATNNLMAIEEAEYSVTRQVGEFEIRQYAPFIVAEVAVSGDFKDAGNKAFRKLFKYISGANQSKGKIAMTAPVSQTPQSEKIAMTAPVSQQASEGDWLVSFMMPSEYTMETIPEPTDSAVVLRKVPGHRAAAIQYSGTWSEKNYQKHLDRLQAWLNSENLAAAGEPVWARYNSPFAPWFMRRNEVLVRLDG